MADKMTELNFPTPLGLAVSLRYFEGIAQNPNIDKSRVLVSTVVRELSFFLYNLKNCKSVSVEPTHDVDLLDKYCLKEETRLLLESTDYYPPLVDVGVSDFIKALEEDEELKKFISILVYTKN